MARMMRKPHRARSTLDAALLPLGNGTALCRSPGQPELNFRVRHENKFIIRQRTHSETA